MLQQFPELHLRVQSENLSRTSTTSPNVGYGGAITPPEYVHSPNSSKRRRFSDDGEQDERARQVPRLYTNFGAAPQRPSPTLPPRSAATESWAGSARTSPLLPSGGLAAARSPLMMEVNDRQDSRMPFPTLPVLNFDPVPDSMSRVRGRSTDDYHSRPGMAFEAPPTMETSPIAFRPSHYSYPYSHPTRVQSLSVGSIQGIDRTPFTSTAYGQQYHDYRMMNEMGGMHGDTKQRKRRGNLPKETTDKLRAWFVAHMNHPYPTEDEKQELMRQTGLQMSRFYPLVKC